MQVLLELNDGIEDDCMDNDGEAVLAEASMVSEGKLSKPGFIKAISLWYAICDKRQAIKQVSNTATASTQSACCIIC